jgi:ferredoxin-NADP reductase
VLLDGIETDAAFVAAWCDGGYTTNLPLEDVIGGKAWLAWGYDGRPLAPSTAVRCGCSCRTCTSGRAPNGCAGWSCAPLEITVERLPEGELSYWLVDEARPGDLLDLRGPIGGYFVWEPSRGGPLLLVAGGSGLVPLMCSSATAGARRRRSPRRCCCPRADPRTCCTPASSTALRSRTRAGRRTAGPATTAGSTRRCWRRSRRRPARPRCFVCGPTAFVEHVAQDLVDLGHHARSSRRSDSAQAADRAA